MKETITYEEFLKVDLRTGTIVQGESVAKSKKLLKLLVNFGEVIGERTILAGIAGSFSPESVVGLKVVAVINLAAREMFGIQSHGMLLAAHTADDKLSLVTCLGVPDGNDVG